MKHIDKTTRNVKFVLLAAVVVKIFQMVIASEFSRLAATVAVVPLIFTGDILKHFKVRIPAIVEIIFLTFLFVSSILGSLFYFYEYVEHFDKFAHMLSGVLTAVLGAFILKKWQVRSKNQLAFELIFMNIFSLSVASMWEIYEFLATKVLGSDLQRVGVSGVTDTMHDIIVAFIGSLAVSGMYYAMVRNEKFRKLSTRIASLI